MNIGVLGTGMVGNAIATKLISLGHHVMMGSRSADNEKAMEWVKKSGELASQGTFADTGAFGEILFNCTGGVHSIQVLESIPVDALKGKLLLDISNPLDFSQGMPPRLSVCNDDSIGEQIQRTFPDVKVVKTLNTCNCDLMVNPGLLPENTDMFLCGNDEDAKQQVLTILKDWFGWKRVLDLGDITMARGMEAFLPLWIRMWGALGTANFNIKIVQG